MTQKTRKSAEAENETFGKRKMWIYYRDAFGCFQQSRKSKRLNHTIILEQEGRFYYKGRSFPGELQILVLA